MNFGYYVDFAIRLASLLAEREPFRLGALARRTNASIVVSSADLRIEDKCSMDTCGMESGAGRTSKRYGYSIKFHRSARFWTSFV
ncbi:hypothetical protein [Lactococcus protaetiae]|uniref:Uncharacterized protein n=1 Tax=Lactococcus protaetiae TaxID=2592653 RepID=A0A514Z965_9LACT|nr:hypothetical protein [Lactococcus protaetiae]QDK71114.1 hypothetical protein FLP15_08080 [Lactococcus protaetiae]